MNMYNALGRLINGLTSLTYRHDKLNNFNAADFTTR